MEYIHLYSPEMNKASLCFQWQYYRQGKSWDRTPRYASARLVLGRCYDGHFRSSTNDDLRMGTWPAPRMWFAAQWPGAERDRIYAQWRHMPLPGAATGAIANKSINIRRNPRPLSESTGSIRLQWITAVMCCARSVDSCQTRFVRGVIAIIYIVSHQK